MPEMISRSSLGGGVPAGALQPPANPFLGILPAEMWDRPKRIFFATLEALGVAPGQAGVASFRADPNHDFVGYIACGEIRANDAPGTDKSADPVVVTVQLEDGTQFQQAGKANAFANLFGSAKQPALWTLPLIIPAGQSVSFTFTNLHNADTLNIRATVQGFNVQKS